MGKFINLTPEIKSLIARNCRHDLQVKERFEEFAELVKQAIKYGKNYQETYFPVWLKNRGFELTKVQRDWIFENN